MKKIFAIILAVAMLATMSVTAFAAENAGGDTSINVKGIYVDGGSVSEVISVDIAWGAMEFSYQDSGRYWDASTHTTKVLDEAIWTATGNTITVTNHSNVAIDASFRFDPNVEDPDAVEIWFSQIDDIELADSQKTLQLDRAKENSAMNSSQSTMYALLYSGNISKSYDCLGTITVTIKKVTD